MAAGLQCWDPSGNLVVDITSRLTRFVGSVTLDGGAASGSVTDPKLVNGAVWTSFQPNFTWGFINLNTARPLITVSGTTISWAYSASGASTGYLRIPGTLFYGVN